MSIHGDMIQEYMAENAEKPGTRGRKGETRLSRAVEKHLGLDEGLLRPTELPSEEREGG